MSATRLQGLDLARYLALSGMVLVNFHLAMGAEQGGSGWLAAVFSALEGRASACFVILAGMGLMLGFGGQPVRAQARLLRRAAFLMVLGLLNLLIFPADILHYYAVYFLLGMVCLTLATRQLLWLTLALLLGSPLLHLWLDYGAGWDWTTLVYHDLWSPDGFLRNLLFNGWHPVLPWFAFMTWGMWLARQDWRDAQRLRCLCQGSAVLWLMAELASWLALQTWPQWQALLATRPLPPLPLYMLAAGASGSLLIGLCLLALQRWPQGGWHYVLPAGRMTLTLYLAHIVLGMGTLESIGWLQGRSLREVALASLLFMLCATLFAFAWARFQPQGPLESLLRRCCDGQSTPASARQTSP